MQIVKYPYHDIDWEIQQVLMAIDYFQDAMYSVETPRREKYKESLDRLNRQLKELERCKNERSNNDEQSY
jgi:hypothetical protein